MLQLPMWLYAEGRERTAPQRQSAGPTDRPQHFRSKLREHFKFNRHIFAIVALALLMLLLVPWLAPFLL